MSKRKNKNTRNYGVHKQLNKELVTDRVMELLKYAELTKAQKIEVEIYKITMRPRIWLNGITIYGVNMITQPKYFKKAVRDNFVVGKVLNNFSDYHMTMVTKCNIFDMDWRNFLDSKGKKKKVSNEM